MPRTRPEDQNPEMQKGSKADQHNKGKWWQQSRRRLQCFWKHDNVLINNNNNNNNNNNKKFISNYIAYKACARN